MKHVHALRGAAPGGAVVKNPPAMQETQEMGFDPWVGKCYGQTLLGHSPWGLEESDRNE